MLYNKYFGLLLYFQGLQSLENGYLAYINENLYNSFSNSVFLGFLQRLGRGCLVKFNQICTIKVFLWKN